MANTPPQLQAGGNITPSRFIKLSTTARFTALQAGAGERAIGISHESTKEVPAGSSPSALAAAAGEQMRHYGLGDVCLLTAAGAITAGDLLKSDANGKGTPATANNEWYGAQALEAATADGQLINVHIISGFVGA